MALRLTTQFTRDSVSSINGTSVDISRKVLSGGDRIFNNAFGNALANLDATANQGDQNIGMAIRNSTRPRPSLFVPEVVFDLLARPQIRLASLRVRGVYSWYTRNWSSLSHLCKPGEPNMSWNLEVARTESHP